MEKIIRTALPGVCPLAVPAPGQVSLLFPWPDVPETGTPVRRPGRQGAVRHVQT